MHVTRTVKGAASGSREVESAGTDGGVTGSGEGQDRRQLRHRQISQVHDPISMNAQEAEPVHVQVRCTSCPPPPLGTLDLEGD